MKIVLKSAGSNVVTTTIDSAIPWAHFRLAYSCFAACSLNFFQAYSHFLILLLLRPDLSCCSLPKRKEGILVLWTWAVKILMKTVRGFAVSGAVREKRTLSVIEFQRNCAGPTASLNQNAKMMTSTASRWVFSANLLLVHIFMRFIALELGVILIMYPYPELRPPASILSAFFLDVSIQMLRGWKRPPVQLCR